MNISEKIKELRNEHGLTQYELAKIIDVDRSAVSYWENKTNEPKASYIFALAKFFNVTTDYLLGLSNDYVSSVIVKKSTSSEIQEIHDELTPLDQQKLIGYGSRLLEEQKEKQKRNRA